MYLSPSFLWFTQAQRGSAGGERREGDGGSEKPGKVQRQGGSGRSRGGGRGGGRAVIQGTGWASMGVGFQRADEEELERLMSGEEGTSCPGLPQRWRAL